MQVKLTSVCKSFDTHSAALDEISLELDDVHALVLIGPSGSGKTTLLRTLAGLETPDRGEIEINGAKLIFDELNLMRHRRSIGMVFQAFNLFPHLSAIDNICLPLIKVHGLNPELAHDQANLLLDRFQLKAHAHKLPAQLSGGQQQRVSIARAIAIKPLFLLFDEPTSALDPEMTAEVLDVIVDLRREGRDLILVTHQMNFARQVADFCVFFDHGKIVEKGPSETLFDRPESPQLQNFLKRVLKY